MASVFCFSWLLFEKVTGTSKKHLPGPTFPEPEFPEPKIRGFPFRGIPPRKILEDCSVPSNKKLLVARSYNRFTYCSISDLPSLPFGPTSRSGGLRHRWHRALGDHLRRLDDRLVGSFGEPRQRSRRSKPARGVQTTVQGAPCWRVDGIIWNHNMEFTPPMGPLAPEDVEPTGGGRGLLIQQDPNTV